MRTTRSSIIFAVRYASGVQAHRADGYALIATTLSTSSILVARLGIPLALAGAVRGVVISGAGPLACAVQNGLYMKTGIQRIEMVD